MLDLDFHNLLNADEFVHLVRDVLEIRENGLKFTSYKRGKDKGIDIRCTNSVTKIIGQVKLFNPDNYRSLLSSLRAEVIKCKQHQPDRYILCIGNQLSPQQATEILDLFEGYIQCEEDIIDGIKLNKYINRPEYERLKKVYASLLVPDLTYVEHIIDRVVNRRILNNTEAMFEKIREFHSLYYNTSQYRRVLKKLNEDRIVILTGNPGVGKTTTAEMIIQQLLVRTWDYVYKLDQVLDIQDIFLKNKKQLFFVDDFWGLQMEKRMINRDYLKRFVEIVGMIQRSENHYLIMTSRTYIVQSVLNHAEEEVQQTLNLNNYTILLEGYSPEDKAKIFFNHLLFYNCNRDIFEYFRYRDELEFIIEHDNYSPRHIEYFLKYIYSSGMNGYTFNKTLQKYLDKPHEYWKKVLDLQSDTARFILLVILISSDPIRKEDLKTTLKSVYSHIHLNLDIQLLSFEEELRTLENLFITSDEDEEGTVWIQFNSPGVGDYVLEYLRENIDFWGQPLIQGACFFNQLYYVFDTKKKEFHNPESDIPLISMEIILSSELQLVLKNKILQDFDHLNLSTGLFCEITDQLNYKHQADELEYFKFSILNQLFSVENNTDVRDFIVKRIKRDILLSNEGIEMMPSESMLRFPFLLKDLRTYIKIAPETILTAFHKSICLAVEYTYFYEFAEIFPKEFEAFYTKHIKGFRRHIRELIIGNVVYFEDSDEDWKIDILIDSNIEELQKEYGIRLNKRLIDDIVYYSGKPYSRFKRYPQIVQKSQKQTLPIEDRYRKISLAERIVSIYIDEPDVEIQDPAKFIRKNCQEKYLRQWLLNQVKNEQSPVRGFLDTSYSLLALIEYLSVTDKNREAVSEYSFLDVFVGYYFSRSEYGIPTDKLVALLIHLALEYFKCFKRFRERIYYTDVQLKQWLKKNGIECVDLNGLYPFLIRTKKWYTFLNYELLLYFAVEAIVRIEDVENYSKMTGHMACEDSKLLVFLDKADSERFRKEILGMEIHRFLSKLNVNSSKEVVLSFLKYFNPGFGLTWNRKHSSFDIAIESSDDDFVEELIRFMGISFEVIGFEDFFYKDCYWGDGSVNFKKYSQGYKILYNRLLLVFGLIDENGKLLKSTDEEFHLNLYQFAEDSDNYQALQKVGLEDYIMGVYQEILSKLDKAVAVN